ncbi:MAG TPA: methyltransferase [Mariprofundaceae bacterium]|nr:methyltransferase [Mariprofundaceae bacterium]
MQGYRLKFEHYRIGDHIYRIRSLRDKQQYYDPDGTAEKVGITSANWSLFGVVWPAAQMLARHMDSYAIEGRRILEVGCGLALASIVLHRRGADITTSDYHPMVPTFLRANMMLNHLTHIDTISGNWAETEKEPERFDLIIGSDILYERGHFDLLSAFINRHARAEAEVVIVDPGRGHTGKFSRRMETLGYTFSEERTEMQLANRQPFRGRIMTYRRSLARSGLAKGAISV